MELEIWQYKRYGITFSIPSAISKSYYSDFKETMLYDEYKKMIGEDSSKYLDEYSGQEAGMKYMADILAEATVNPRTMYLSL